MIKARINSFKYAWQGVRELAGAQPNVRIHLGAAVAALGLAWFLALPAAEWALLLLTIAGVLAAEAFNTAVEYLTDLVSPEHHPLAGKIKDVAAAGVLLAALGALGVGLCLFGPRLLG